MPLDELSHTAVYRSVARVVLVADPDLVLLPDQEAGRIPLDPTLRRGCGASTNLCTSTLSSPDADPLAEWDDDNVDALLADWPDTPRWRVGLFSDPALTLRFDWGSTDVPHDGWSSADATVFETPARGVVVPHTRADIHLSPVERALVAALVSAVVKDIRADGCSTPTSNLIVR